MLHWIYSSSGSSYLSLENYDLLNFGILTSTSSPAAAASSFDWSFISIFPSLGSELGELWESVNRLLVRSGCEKFSKTIALEGDWSLNSLIDVSVLKESDPSLGRIVVGASYTSLVFALVVGGFFLEGDAFFVFLIPFASGELDAAFLEFYPFVSGEFEPSFF